MPSWATPILAVCSSEDGSTVSVEYLRMLSETHYENRGFLLRNGEKVGSWDLELTRRDRSIPPRFDYRDT